MSTVVAIRLYAIIILYEPLKTNKIIIFFFFSVYHSFETNIKMKLLGFGKTKEVKPLNEEMGVELAAEMLGEMFIFSIAAGTIYFEYKRQQWKEQDKENVQNSRLAELEEVVLSMESQMEKQNTKIKHLNEIMLASVPKKKLPDRIVDKKSSAILHVEKT